MTSPLARRGTADRPGAAGPAALDLHQLTTSGLLLLHAAVRHALQVDDALAPAQPVPYDVRSIPDWRHWCSAIEEELRQRQASFVPIPWWRGRTSRTASVHRFM